MSDTILENELNGQEAETVEQDNPAVSSEQETEAETTLKPAPKPRYTFGQLAK